MTLNKRNWEPVMRDIFISKGSATVAMLGAFLIAVSFHPAIAEAGIGIMSLGAGFSPFVRSIASSLVDPRHLGTLYTLMVVMATVGVIISGPIIAVSFDLGLRLGGLWSGLPYLINSGLFLLSVVSLSFIRPWMNHELLTEEDGYCDMEPEES
jgi:hypothetical protein